MNAEMINKIDLTLVTELDWQLFQLQRKYLDYQVNIGNRIIAVLAEWRTGCSLQGSETERTEEDVPGYGR